MNSNLYKIIKQSIEQFESYLIVQKRALLSAEVVASS